MPYDKKKKKKRASQDGNYNQRFLEVDATLVFYLCRISPNFD